MFHEIHDEREARLEERIKELTLRDKDWQNLNMLYRRKIAQLTLQLQGNGIKPVSKLDEHIIRFQDILGCGPDLLRIE